MNASPITKIIGCFKILGKNLHLVGCATVCAKSEVMLNVDDYYSSAGLNLKSALHAAAAELNCLGVLLEFNASQII